MHVISANDLKTKGVSALANDNEIIITVRGKAEYVVLDMETYDHLREAELEVALLQAKRDLKNKDFIIEDVDAHIKRISKKGGRKKDRK